MTTMKQKLWTIILIISSSVLTLNFSTFTNPFLLLTIPGILFGLAMTLPRVWIDFKSYLSEIIIGILYPFIWAVSIGISLVFQFITPSQSDKTPFIIVGLLAGIGISIIFDWQFGLKNKKIGIILISLFSVISLLLFDNFFPKPHDKELNIGRQIAIWQVLVGVCILATEKRK